MKSIIDDLKIPPASEAEAKALRPQSLFDKPAPTIEGNRPNMVIVDDVVGSQTSLAAAMAMEKVNDDMKRVFSRAERAAVTGAFDRARAKDEHVSSLVTKTGAGELRLYNSDRIFSRMPDDAEDALATATALLTQEPGHIQKLATECVLIPREKEPSPRLETGDVVMLKSGGPAMTVHNVTPHASNVWLNKVTLAYFDRDGDECWASHHEGSLVRVDADRVAATPLEHAVQCLELEDGDVLVAYVGGDRYQQSRASDILQHVLGRVQKRGRVPVVVMSENDRLQVVRVPPAQRDEREAQKVYVDWVARGIDPKDKG